MPSRIREAVLLDSHVIGSDLSAQVTSNFFFRPYIGQDHLQNVGNYFSLDHKLDHRKNDPLLVNFSESPNAGERSAANVNVVTRGVRNRT
jgi:hypothetical protein